MGNIPMLLLLQITQNLCMIFELLSSAIVLWNLRLAHLLWNVSIGQILRRKWVDLTFQPHKYLLGFVVPNNRN
jgi:hypothetical protein